MAWVCGRLADTLAGRRAQPSASGSWPLMRSPPSSISANFPPPTRSYAWLDAHRPTSVRRDSWGRCGRGRWEPLNGPWVESDCCADQHGFAACDPVSGRTAYSRRSPSRMEPMSLPGCQTASALAAGLPPVAAPPACAVLPPTKLAWRCHHSLSHRLFRWRGRCGAELLTLRHRADRSAMAIRVAIERYQAGVATGHLLVRMTLWLARGGETHGRRPDCRGCWSNWRWWQNPARWRLVPQRARQHRVAWPYPGRPGAAPSEPTAGLRDVASNLEFASRELCHSRARDQKPIHKPQAWSVLLAGGGSGGGPCPGAHSRFATAGQPPESARAIADTSRTGEAVRCSASIPTCLWRATAIPDVFEQPNHSSGTSRPAVQGAAASAEYQRAPWLAEWRPETVSAPAGPGQLCVPRGACKPAVAASCRTVRFCR